MFCHNNCLITPNIQVACLLVLLQSCTTRINWTSATPLRHRRQSAYFAAQSRDLTNNFRERRVQNALHPSLDIQSVPVIPIPLPAKSAKHHNMDVAAMSSSTQRFPDGAGVSDDELLSYFPADVLKSTAKFRPVRVRVIEHEDYIDYELAFVEEKEEGKEDGGEEEEVATAATKEDESRSNEDIDIASTERPADVQITAPSFTAVTFVNLLERARRRHHELMAAAVAATRAAPIQSTTPMTPPAAKSSKGSVLVQSRDRIRNSRVPLRSNFFRIKHSYEKKADMASAAFPGVSGSRQQRIPLRVSRTEETTTTRSAMLTTLPVPSFSQVSTPLTQPSTQPPQSNKFTNVQTVSAMVVTRNVTSTRVMTNREAHWLSTTTPATTVPPTERLQFPAAASSLLLKPEHEKLGKVLSTIKKETVFETTFPTITTTTTTTPATITTSTIASVAATTIASLSTSSISAQSSTTTTTISPTTSAEIMLDREVLEPRSSAGAKNRIPRIIEPSKWEEDAPAQVLSGETKLLRGKVLGHGQSFGPWGIQVSLGLQIAGYGLQAMEK